MSKTCYCRLKSSRRICKCASIMHLLEYVLYIFVKRKVCKEGHGHCTFSFTITIIREVQVNLSSYKALMLDIKQVLSNMLNHEATQVPHATTNTFLTLQLLHILISVSLTAGDVTGCLHTCMLQLLY